MARVIMATFLGVLASMVIVSVSFAIGPKQNGSVPPGPVFYKGSVQVMGEPGAQDLNLVACIDGCQDAGGWQSAPAIIPDAGRYHSLTIGPPDESYIGKEVTYHLITDWGSTQAEQTTIYNTARNADEITQVLDLTFGAAPPSQPTPTPAPTATPTPVPTSTPVLPIPGDPSVPRLSWWALIVGLIAIGLGFSLLGRKRWRSRHE